MGPLPQTFQNTKARCPSKKAPATKPKPKKAQDQRGDYYHHREVTQREFRSARYQLLIYVYMLKDDLGQGNPCGLCGMYHGLTDESFNTTQTDSWSGTNQEEGCKSTIKARPMGQESRWTSDNKRNEIGRGENNFLWFIFSESSATSSSSSSPLLQSSKQNSCISPNFT
ncbi:hypothetical protein KSP40_PGU021575 [Platanthera guangdongensis]|uniref:Uncharacterized protein n=1 Tax=Platanthera guangdongensis TaxID=2320717 RepID=A0ABR2MXK3_9ASPA